MDFMITNCTQKYWKCLTSAGPSLLSRRMSGEGGLPVRLSRPTPPSILRGGLLQPGPLLGVLWVESASAPALLHLPLSLSLPDHVGLPLALSVWTWPHSPPSAHIFMQSRAPGAWSPPALPVRGRADSAVVWLGEPGWVHPKVWLWGGFALAAWTPAPSSSPSASSDPHTNRQRVAVLHVVLLQVCCICFGKKLFRRTYVFIQL